MMSVSRPKMVRNHGRPAAGRMTRRPSTLVSTRRASRSRAVWSAIWRSTSASAERDGTSAYQRVVASSTGASGVSAYPLRAGTTSFGPISNGMSISTDQIASSTRSRSQTEIITVHSGRWRVDRGCGYAPRRHRCDRRSPARCGQPRDRHDLRRPVAYHVLDLEQVGEVAADLQPHLDMPRLPGETPHLDALPQRMADRAQPPDRRSRWPPRPGPPAGHRGRGW